MVKTTRPKRPTRVTRRTVLKTAAAASATLLFPMSRLARATTPHSSGPDHPTWDRLLDHLGHHFPPDGPHGLRQWISTLLQQSDQWRESLLVTGSEARETRALAQATKLLLPREATVDVVYPSDLFGEEARANSTRLLTIERPMVNARSNMAIRVFAEQVYYLKKRGIAVTAKSLRRTPAGMIHLPIDPYLHEELRDPNLFDRLTAEQDAFLAALLKGPQRRLA